MQPFKPQAKEPRYGGPVVPEKALGYETTDISIRGVLGFALFLVLGGVFVFLFCLVLFNGLNKMADKMEAPQTVWELQSEKLAEERRREAKRLGVPEKQVLQLEMNRRVQGFPQPRLQTDDIREMQTLRAVEDLRLSNYYWIDKSAGKVHIPIDVAIKILAERGLPAIESPEASAQTRMTATTVGVTKGSRQSSHDYKH